MATGARVRRAPVDAPGYYSGGATVSPHDTNELTKYSRALLIGGAGNIVVVTEDNSTITITGVIAGQLLPIACKIVKSTNTTCTNITALW